MIPMPPCGTAAFQVSELALELPAGRAYHSTVTPVDPKNTWPFLSRQEAIGGCSAHANRAGKSCRL